jgi:hypothetical protein
VAQPMHEGMVDFHGWQTWYRITGDLSPDRTPLLIVHGGQGAAHNYPLRYADLADDGRTVIHYDQLGVGRSTSRCVENVRRPVFRSCNDDDPVAESRIFVTTVAHVCFANITSTCDPFGDQSTLGECQDTCSFHVMAIAQKGCGHIDPGQLARLALRQQKKGLKRDTDPSYPGASRDLVEFAMDKHLHTTEDSTMPDL